MIDSFSSADNARLPCLVSFNFSSFMLGVGVSSGGEGVEEVLWGSVESGGQHMTGDGFGGIGSVAGSIVEADLYFVTLTLTVSVVCLGTPHSATSGRCPRIKNDLILRQC